MTAGSEDVTNLLRDATTGRDVSAPLFDAVYGELRKIAEHCMAKERRDHTLQTTALVHEAYLRLVHAPDVAWENRAHFYGAAAEAMRRILVEHARARGRDKRGGGAARMPLGLVDLASEGDSIDILAVDDALAKLATEDESIAQVVRLRFFAGLSVDETAFALKRSRRTVHREWSYARARLYQLMTGGAA